MVTASFLLHSNVLLARLRRRFFASFGASFAFAPFGVARVGCVSRDEAVRVVFEAGSCERVNTGAVVDSNLVSTSVGFFEWVSARTHRCLGSPLVDTIGYTSPGVSIAYGDCGRFSGVLVTRPLATAGSPSIRGSGCGVVLAVVVRRGRPLWPAHDASLGRHRSKASSTRPPVVAITNSIVKPGRCLRVLMVHAMRCSYRSHVDGGRL